jgi:hypothetical protein
MKRISGRKFTAKQLAEQFGCSVQTISSHAVKLFGAAPTDNGKAVARLFDEAQVTIILESIKSQEQSIRLQLKEPS